MIFSSQLTLLRTALLLSVENAPMPFDFEGALDSRARQGSANPQRALEVNPRQKHTKVSQTCNIGRCQATP
ncbi:hypothetical protein ASPCAL01161 [Aspergillus calidoustus]|uniref:Secreted protein n=1 Tax=Aspergillus calidoustus TaxID=454130 RepID=A0A0U5C2C3_ASPCI|nr:hypothetical protein ASPCAL01161 [Aspergillus calidoustus]